jgi:hypothetical protein
MLRRMALVRTDVSEEFVFIIRVTRIGELGTTLAVTSVLRLLVTAKDVGCCYSSPLQFESKLLTVIRGTESDCSL